MTTHFNTNSDGVTVITLDNAPVNSLSSSLVKSLIANVERAIADSKTKVIVVTGKGNFFSGGAEIAEFELAVKAGAKKEVVAGLHQMCYTMDKSPKPIVAAINGFALGGGCEVTLACHGRVMAANAKIGVPEVNLGLLPGGQGTQRLSRLLPLEHALQLMVMGAPIPAARAQKIGLVHAVHADPKVDIVAAAAQFGFQMLENPALARPIPQLPIPKGNKMKLYGGALSTVLVQADRFRKGQIAPEKICDCVRAAITAKTFEEGCDFEMERFVEVMYSVQSKAMRHLFFAERLANKVEGLTAKPTKLKKIGIIGSGTMGGGIAMNFANKGVEVILVDVKQEFLDRGLKAVQNNYNISVKRGSMKPDVAKKRMALIKGSLDYKDLADVDMVIEAVFEDLELKKKIFKALDAACRKDAYLCTNTSGLNIDAIAEVVSHPERVMGTHFFSPANVMKLLENVRTAKASPQTIATSMAMAKQIGKVAVLVGNCDGFVGNRMLAPYSAESQQCIEEGASPLQIDDACTAFGMAMGPVTLGDLVGLDLFWRNRKASGKMDLDTKTSIGPFDLGDWLCEQGRFGQKTGRGFYIYGKDRSKTVCPEMLRQCEVISAAKGMTRRAFSADEILERLFFPLINEGFKILEEGMAQRPSDLDIVYIYGYGFPPVKGGPMFYADNYVGLPKILDRLKYYDAQAKARYTTNKNYRRVDYFEPSKLLEECVASGKTLSEFWEMKSKAKKSKL